MHICLLAGATPCKLAVRKLAKARPLRDVIVKLIRHSTSDSCFDPSERCLINLRKFFYGPQTYAEFRCGVWTIYKTPNIRLLSSLITTVYPDAVEFTLVVVRRDFRLCIYPAALPPHLYMPETETSYFRLVDHSDIRRTILDVANVLSVMSTNGVELRDVPQQRSSLCAVMALAASSVPPDSLSVRKIFGWTIEEL